MPDYQDLVMFAATLADILGKGKQSRINNGVNWMTCCPAHDDANPSLAIYVDEQIRFKCFAGCEDSAIRAGVKLAMPGRDIPLQTRFKGNSGAIVTNRIAHAELLPDDEWLLSVWQQIPDQIYTYRNTEGQPLFFVVRYDRNPPDFPQKVIKQVCSARPKQGGGNPFWIAQAYPGTKVLYNLPDLAERPSAPVLLVEGEKAADAARVLLPDYVVMTWAGGSSAAKLANLMPLQGREVTLWPDNDEPGIAAMKTIAAILSKGSKAAAKVTLVFDEINDNFPVGFDLGDTYEDTYTPLEYLLNNSSEVDPKLLPDVVTAADEEEVASRLQGYLDRYVVTHSGGDHLYVDILSASPHSWHPIPYQYLTRTTLEAKEVDSYLNLKTGKRRKFITDFIESNRKLWINGYAYDPSSSDRILSLTGGERRLNTYCGLAHQPVACEPKLYQPFINHIYASCQSREEGNYLLDWIACKVQSPATMTGTMIILSGRQGCGKTIVCDIVRAILGRHNAVKIGLSDLTGQFNSQYANKLFIDVEEYDPGGNRFMRELREKVKNLITAQTMMVNTKGLPAYQNPAYHSIIATTNATYPEAISFDNRRMTFIKFDNKLLRVDRRIISDNPYFAPLYALKDSPKALSGLCHYLTERQIDIGKITKPLDTELTEEAMEFVDDVAFAFLRSIADTGELPTIDELPDKDNPFPLNRWPKQATALPRRTLSRMFRDWAYEFRREIIPPEKAGAMLLRTLMRGKRPRKGEPMQYQYPRGIPETYAIDKNKRWSMVSTWQTATSEMMDRAICIPDLDELRYMLNQMAGVEIPWSDIDKEDAPGGNVVEFPAKKDEEPF